MNRGSKAQLTSNVSLAASDRAFVSASTGLTTTTQSSGNFEISSKNVGTPAQNLSIGQVSSSSDRVDIAGSFGGSNWTWTLSFSLEPGSSQALVFNASVAGGDVANVYLAYESPLKKPSSDWGADWNRQSSRLARAHLDSRRWGWPR